MATASSILIVILALNGWTLQAQTAVPQDTRIMLLRTPNAFLHEPYYRLTITSDGTVVFERIRGYGTPAFYPPTSGPVRTTIPIESVAALVAAFERVKFFSLKGSYARTEDGCPGVWTDYDGAEISITINGKSKTISHYHGCLADPDGLAYPAELTMLELKIDETVNTKQWFK